MGDRFQAQCMVHDDRTPSMSVRTGENGGVVIFCHSCGREATAAILEALDLTFRDLYSSEVQAQSSRRSQDRLSSPNVSDQPGPEPKPYNTDPSAHGFDGEAEIYGLLRRFEQGTAQPLRISLGTPSAPLTPSEQAAADFIELAMGLRASVDDFQPLPCSTAWLAARLGWDHAMQAHRALNGLKAKAVIRYAGNLPRSRARTYQPVGSDIESQAMLLLFSRETPESPGAVTSPVPGAHGFELGEVVQVGEELVAADPAVKVHDELPVDGAEPVLVAPARAVGMVTTRDAARDLGTDGALGHSQSLDPIASCPKHLAARFWRSSPIDTWHCASCVRPADRDVDWYRPNVSEIGV